VKLSPAPDNPMVRRRQNPSLPPELVDGEEEYIVEEILNSRMFRRKLQYLVKWEGYGIEGNTWEYSENLAHAPEKVTDFHTRNLGAPCCIRALTFGSIPFRPIPLSSASSRCSSRWGGDCKGNPFHFRLLPAFRFRSRSRHLVSLPQCLQSHDIVRHPLLTRFPSDPPSAYDTLTQHICRTLHVFTNFGLISYIHYFVY